MQPAVNTRNSVLRPFEQSDATHVQSLAVDSHIAEMTENIPHPYDDGMAENWIETLKPCMGNAENRHVCDIFWYPGRVTWILRVTDFDEAQTSFTGILDRRCLLKYWMMASANQMDSQILTIPPVVLLNAWFRASIQWNLWSFAIPYPGERELHHQMRISTHSLT